ncbi:MAG: ATP-dependent zinc metalloprotease FtsH [Candidatus Sericytochromatia bacterium]|nr:ATP-dependent zinc metalloprotease FtsH [Candidatus Tanganyikabacteria bacterium]
MDGRDARTIWWALGAALLFWLAALAFLPHDPRRPEIAYTALRDYLAAGEVARLEIQGQRVTASLRRGDSLDVVTTLPPVQDVSFWSLVKEHRTEVWVRPEAGRWWLDLALVAVPILLLVLLLTRVGGRTDSQPNAFSFGQSRARLWNAERPSVTFADVAGVDEAKEELREIVEYLKTPERFHRLGARVPRGVLLAGPPGTGKTLLARAAAGEAQVPFFSICATEFVEMFVGVGSSRVRDLFEKAKARSPALIFIDELDAVGRRRGNFIGNVNDEREQTLNQLLAEMDGFEPRTEVIVLAATNRADVLDPAILRPGRFDRRVVVGLPDRTGREAILAIHLKSVPAEPGVDIATLAGSTAGFSGADLANLVNEAALMAAKAGLEHVTARELDQARDKAIMGVRRNVRLSADERRIVAYHEAGHALVAHYLPGADPLHKVTIIPHGMALGATQLLPDADRHNLPRGYLLDRLAVMVGGRVAEELAFGDVTTGAENDLREMAQVARAMVTRWRMTDEPGLMAISPEGDEAYGPYGRQYSDQTAALIDREVRRLGEEAISRARAVLTRHRLKLDRLADTLLEQEVVLRPDIERIAADL